MKSMLVNYNIPTGLGSTNFGFSSIITACERKGLQWLQGFDTRVVFHPKRLCQLFHPLTHIFSALWNTLSQSTTSSCCHCVSSPIEFFQRKPFCSYQTFDQKLLQNAVVKCISAWVAGQQIIFMYLISLGFHCSQ